MIIKELPLTIILNNRELVTLLCSPSSLKYLAVGFLLSEGLIKGKDEIKKIIVDDLGRHNAIDKIIGECILKDIPTEDRAIIISGRISSDILHKVAKRGVPILISKAVPTNLGVRLASDLGITLIGFVRGRRMNVYANS